MGLAALQVGPLARRLRKGATRAFHKAVRVRLRAIMQGPRARALAPIAALATGLRPIAAAQVAIASDGTVTPLSDDGWIEWVPDAAVVRRAPFGLLTIAVPGSGEAACGRLLVDLGDGFAEGRSVAFDLAGGEARLLLSDLSHVARMRWAFGEGRQPIAAPRVVLEALPDAEAVAVAMRAHVPDAEEAERLLSIYARAFGKGRRGQRFGLLPDALALRAGLSGVASFGHNYALWLLVNGRPTPEGYRLLAERTATLATRFSFILPTYETPPALLAECLDSLLAQTYPHFDICIADDASRDPAVLETIRAYAARDPRVRYVARTANGHISAASNSALALATGDFVVLVDHDDVLPDHALAVIAAFADTHRAADIFFSDEDKISPGGERMHPYFKGGFDRFLMYGHNMVSHLGVYRRTLVEAIGGFREGFEGSQDYDLLLRAVETCGDDRVVHVPHILYHWRAIPGSTALSADQKSYAVLAAGRAIDEHFERTGTPLRSVPGPVAGLTSVEPAFAAATPVSIIIPTRDRLDLLRPCIRSIVARPGEGMEIIVVDNGSEQPETLAWLDALAADGTATVRHDPGPFNFSEINNRAAAAASGEILCFLNNDTEIVSDDWLARARALLSMAEVGGVGARLLFPDGRLQHMGIVLGMGRHGVAGLPHNGHPGGAPGYFGKARLMQQVSAATAACLFVRKADFLASGGFDPALRVAYNDVDLCLKLGQRGLRIVVDPGITLVHKESGTRGRDEAGERAERLEREAALMRARWGDTLARDRYWSPNLDLRRDDFAFALCPRVAPPWRIHPSE
jgi:GT2 family glycosyltransferase